MQDSAPTPGLIQVHDFGGQAHRPPRAGRFPLASEAGKFDNLWQATGKSCTSAGRKGQGDIMRTAGWLIGLVAASAFAGSAHAQGITIWSCKRLDDLDLPGGKRHHLVYFSNSPDL